MYSSSVLKFSLNFSLYLSGFSSFSNRSWRLAKAFFWSAKIDSYFCFCLPSCFLKEYSAFSRSEYWDFGRFSPFLASGSSESPVSASIFAFWGASGLSVAFWLVVARVSGLDESGFVSGLFLDSSSIELITSSSLLIFHLIIVR